MNELWNQPPYVILSMNDIDIRLVGKYSLILEDNV